MTPPCVPCGTHAGRSVQPCIRCSSHLSHQHVRIVNRRGQVVADAPLCGSCADTLRIRGEPLSERLDAMPEGSA